MTMTFKLLFWKIIHFQLSVQEQETIYQILNFTICFSCSMSHITERLPKRIPKSKLFWIIRTFHTKKTYTLENNRLETYHVK